MPYSTSDRNLEALRKMLPDEAMKTWCEGATLAESEGREHNDCVRAGWDAVKSAGWTKPERGKMFIKGEDEGHPFRGNQYTQGGGSGKWTTGRDRDGKEVRFWIPGKGNPEAEEETTNDVRVHGFKEIGGGDDHLLYGHKDGSTVSVFDTGAWIHEDKNGRRIRGGANGAAFRSYFGTKKSADFIASSEAQVLKVDAGLGLVFGWAIVSKIGGKDYFDLQHDHIPEQTMLEASCDFMLHSRTAKDMHRGDAIGPIVFAWPMTTDIAKSLGISTPQTGLLIAMKPPKAVLQKFASGEYTGFSIGGQCHKAEDVQ